MEVIDKMMQEDWRKVLEIYAQALEDGKSTFNQIPPSYEEWNNSHIEKCRFVIKERGEVVGWCAISPTSSRKSYAGVVEVSIYIDKKHRGKGFGKKLLTHLCVESEKLGYWSLVSNIFEINVGSIALHKSCGFREVGYREKIARDKFGNWQSIIIFERRNGIV